MLDLSSMCSVPVCAQMDVEVRVDHSLSTVRTYTHMSPQATDCSFMDKCHQQHQKNPHYQKPKKQTPQFAVNHYAGTVWYTVSAHTWPLTKAAHACVGG